MCASAFSSLCLGHDLGCWRNLLSELGLLPNQDSLFSLMLVLLKSVGKPLLLEKDFSVFPSSTQRVLCEGP